VNTRSYFNEIKMLHFLVSLFCYKFLKPNLMPKTFGAVSVVHWWAHTGTS
jgi:hypothetical protein